jgi:hypothetical protein
MSVSLRGLIRASMGSFPAVFAAPSRNREYLDTFLHSMEVVTCTHKRSKPCCTSEFDARPHFLCVGPGQWSEPITVPSRDRAYPPFCGSNFGSLPSPVYTFGSCRPRHTCLWQWVTPTGLVTHCGNTGLGTLPPLLPQSIIDHQNRGILMGIPPSRSSAQGDNCYGTTCPLICKREKIQLTLSSHSRSYGWPYFTAQESLATLVINPRWTFQLQWDLHHTLTMVPLPTFLGRQPPWLLTTSHINLRKAKPLLLNAVIIIIPPVYLQVIC